MNIYTSYLNHVGQPVPETQSLEDIINLVTGDKCKKAIHKIRAAKDDTTAKKLKIELLPLFFPTVQIFNQNSLDDDSIPTGIIQFDIDVQDNPELNFDQLKEAVCAIPETIYAFRSPRGGVKFGIQTDFKKNDDDNLYSLKKRYTQAYHRSLEYVQQFVVIKDDEYMKNLKYACFLSWDQNAYYNPDCTMLVINDQCIYEQPQIIATSEQDISTEQVEELLQFIPHNFGWNERQSINYAVFSCLGRAGIPVLFNHWSTNDQAKLERDLESQYQSFKRNSDAYGSYGHLVNVAKQNGYKPIMGKVRKTLLPKPCNYNFTPLVSYDEGMAQLDHHLQNFFTTGQNSFINVSAGAGKTEAVIQFLKDLPNRNNLKRYNRKRVLVLVHSHDLAKEYKRRLLHTGDGTKAIRANHIQGKKWMCERKHVYFDPYDKAGLPQPINQCIKACDVFETCPYIRQFDDLLTNVRIMTHAELINSPSAWLYGSVGNKPRKGGWKPDYIIVDEDWFTKEEHEENYSDTEYDSIRNIIHDCRNGMLLADAVNAHSAQVLKDNVTMEAGKAKQPKFESAKQFISDSKKSTGKKQSIILKCFVDYILSGDDANIGSIRLFKNKLRASLIKPISDRYKDTPTLFLDATADETVVQKLLDVEFHSIAIKPKDDINLYQLQGRTMLNKDLKDATFRTRLVTGLKSLVQRHSNVGLISYKSVDGVSGNFSQWLGDQCGIQTVGHFGNIRGMDQFKDVDCLLVVGRYLIPDHELANYCYGVFGEAVMDKEYADMPIRMKNGGAIAMNNRPFVDARMRRVKKHFSDSETIQAIGRARVIHGNAKDIYLFSHESLGANVEVTDFFELGDLIDSHPISKLKEVGFCQDKPKPLHELGYTKSRIKENRGSIDSELTKAGISKRTFKVKGANRHTRDQVYYVHDMNKLEHHIAASGGTIMDEI